MPIKIGTTTMTKIAIGNNAIGSAYVGSTLVYSSRAGIPTITVTAHNKFAFSATKAVAYYVSTSSTTPTAGTSQSTFALNKWTTSTSTNELTLTSGTTYYVWAENRTTGGVSKTYASITVRSVTRTQGTGTKLTLKYDSSSGTTFTGTKYVLNGSKVYVTASLNSSYYVDLTIQNNSSSISSDTIITINSNTTITSSATQLSSMNVSGTPVHVHRNVETQTFSFSARRVRRVEIYLLHNIKSTSVELTKSGSYLELGSMWAYSGEDKWFTFDVDSTETWTGIKTQCGPMSNTEGYTIQEITIYYT